MADPMRSQWNERQKALRGALSRGEHAQAVALFLDQHAMLHTAEVARSGLYSFEDALWEGLPEDAARQVPEGQEHSIAWCLWHLTRIEDMTMNVLLAGTPQLFEREGWMARLGVTVRDTGNAMDAAAVAALSAAVDIPALRAYRLAVGQRTREVVQRAQAGQFKQPVEQSRLEQIRAQGGVVEGALGILAYWGSLTLGGLLLMPPTRHGMIHLNEALRLKRKLLRTK